MIAALSAAYPEELPYVHTYKSGEIHPAYWLIGAEADHLVPGSRGGDWLDPANHVAACVFCNTRKSDYTVEELGIEPYASCSEDWSGRIEDYRAVWEFAGRPNPQYHLDWIAAFERSADRSAGSGTGVAFATESAAPKPTKSVPKARTITPSGEWTLESILEAVSKKSASLGSTAQQLSDWVDANDFLIGEVRKTKKPGVYRVYGAGRRQSAIFSLKSSGTVEILFDSLKHHPPFTDPELREELRTRLNEIDGVSVPAASIDDWPTFSLAALADAKSLEHFQATVDWCLKRFPV